MAPIRVLFLINTDQFPNRLDTPPSHKNQAGAIISALAVGAAFKEVGRGLGNIKSEITIAGGAQSRAPPTTILGLKSSTLTRLAS